MIEALTKSLLKQENNADAEMSPKEIADKKEQEERKIIDGYIYINAPIEFKMIFLYIHIWADGGFTDTEKVIINETFEYVTDYSSRVRDQCDQPLCGGGIWEPEHNLIIKAKHISVIRLIHRILTGVETHIITLVDVRNPENLASQVMNPQDIVGIVNQFEALDITASAPSEHYSRRIFIERGGSGHALNLGCELFAAGLDDDSRVIILYTALVNAICPGNQDVINIFKTVKLLFPPILRFHDFGHLSQCDIDCGEDQY
ncbi:MAG: hypothetical protein KAH18_12830 [Psychromonas sp.]|nr:hypothetical protein [Psychromonas sp.]